MPITLSPPVEDSTRMIRALVGMTTRVERIAHSEKSTVYRVERDRRPSLIVKRCAPGVDTIEPHVYAHILPLMSVEHLAYLGSATDEHGAVWLCVEDAGDHEVALDTPAHRRLLTEWVAGFHTAGRDIARPPRLPDRGPTHFACRLAAARRDLHERLAGTADEGDRDTIRRSLDCCAQIERAWPHIEAICARFPPNLIHGDLADENLRLISRRGSEMVVPMDWEKAGWGVPAVDLAGVDTDLYAGATPWLGRDGASVKEMCRIGKVFRQLSHQWTVKSMGKLEHAQRRLARLLAEAEWTPRSAR